jgi:hypothetical protein
MAGVALYGDLTIAAGAAGPIPEVGLELIAVFAPGNPIRIPGREAILRGVTSAEPDDPHPRIYCLTVAVTVSAKVASGVAGADSGGSASSGPAEARSCAMTGAASIEIR